MDLILWRHAEAEDAPGNDDLGRALTARGRKQAERMAAWLAPRLPATTVDAIAPGAAAQAVLDAAGWPAGGGAVLIVGHQPTLGETAARAVGEGDEHWRLRKGAVCWLRNDPGDPGAVAVHARKTPDDL